MSDMHKSNEEIHSFFSETPECPQCTKAYQRGVIDGIRIGENKMKDESIWMVNKVIEYFESKVGEAMIIDMREKIEEEKVKLLER